METIWAQECFYRGSIKRKSVFVDRIDVWLLSRSDMESISTNSSILRKFISDGIYTDSAGRIDDSDGGNQQIRGEENRLD